MKVLLMDSDRDAELDRELPENADALIQDLECDTLLRAMAAGDQLLLEISKRALLLGARDAEEIVYRQQVLDDCLEHPLVARELYDLAGAALQAEHRIWTFHQASPRSILARSVQKLELLVDFLRQLRAIADDRAQAFGSPGLRGFVDRLCEELDEPYLELIEHQLSELKFTGGTLISAQLAAGNKSARHRLREPRARGLVERFLDRSGYSFTVADRDENGFRAVGELEDRGVNLAANALTQAVDHVRGFFVALRTEVGFYVACLNLSDRLAEKGEPICMPVVLPSSQLVFSGRGLYDVALTLTIERKVVRNDVAADHRSLVMITGANQGGKSTFLRSVGQAQLMAQCGMFVAAEALRVNLCDRVFTHFKREEDKAMEGGKLDEELSRMSEIADHIRRNSMLLCNESFASTNEREGSEIARQVIRALCEAGVKTLFVTHMFDLAAGWHRQRSDSTLFLRAERSSDGERSFKIVEGEPLTTSYGADSYRKIFGDDDLSYSLRAPTC